VVTDGAAPAGLVELLRARGVEMILAPAVEEARNAPSERGVSAG
jgi:hypothetical protein